ncbi:peptide/nickel transport system ATP-binding protein [Litorivivens lipolytica]|uniref:ABC-type dipeptide transporter n=1 Tax=Litorivivens lipolytica TaxID=1524264 RepID=A0A7W4Z611_9GAMM|nr:ABC transporter ATP-binding protein [Litorivivens lipolytica]MBB3046460.1 peptide/nickel transport system ATP-binding protein [Litorivivens lipolytica]
MSFLLDVRNLRTRIRGEHATHTVVDGVSLQLRPGETLGLVGESGSGKSLTALSLTGLLPKPDVFVDGGAMIFQDQDLRALSPNQFAKLRGDRISMIFQDPMTALNPVHRIGDQIAEVLTVHGRARKPAQQKQRVIELLNSVGIPQPESRFDSYPHELSGGQRQRVMIAMALACEPALLIADEPTTALDVTVQAQILHLIKCLQREHNTALLFITHDLALVSQISDRIAVMYAGQIVETAASSTLFAEPRHPYTRALLASTPSAANGHKQRLPAIPGTVAKPEQYGEYCRFRNRCQHANEHCRTEAVVMDESDSAHPVRCLRWRELAQELAHVD